MSLDRITQTLLTKFEQSREEHFKVIYWEDPKKDYFEYVQTLELPNVKIIQLDGNNYFRSKVYFEEHFSQSHFLIYAPFNALGDHFKENWLLDVYFYAEKFRADATSQIIDELGLPNSIEMRSEVEKYRKFFENQDRVRRFVKYGHKIKSVVDLQLCILAALVNSPEVRLDTIVYQVISDHLDVIGNKRIEEIKKFGNFEDFINLLLSKYGYVYSDEKPFINFVAHLFVTGLGITINIEKFGFLKPFFEPDYSKNCYSAVHAWAEDSSKQDELRVIAKTVEEMLHMSDKLKQVQLNDLEKLDLFPVFNEMFILKLSEGLVQDILNPVDVENAILRRRETLWYEDVRVYFEVLFYASQVVKFRQTHNHMKASTGYKAVWESYLNDYYQMDQYYRKSYSTYFTSLDHLQSDLDDVTKDLLAYVENVYKTWYLDELGEVWTSHTKELLPESYWLDHLPKQKDFYFDYVSKTLASNKNVFVIISDALRYEVGKELEQVLKGEAKYQTSVHGIQGIFPSITRLGMAALLPHDQIELDSNLDVLVDGYSCGDLVSRQKALSRRGKNALAISAKQFMDLKRQDRSAQFKDKELVYLYHDLIDATGDHQASEKDTFKACDEAVRELRNLVRTILNESLTNTVYITADHGFMYTYKSLQEFDKVSKEHIGSNIKEISRRYAITEESAHTDQLQSVSLKHVNSSLGAVTPLQYIRFKVQGGGTNYVHGGVSLQEIAVPVVKVEKIRGDRQVQSSSTVKIQLVTQVHKVTNRIFSLEFVQSEAVSERNLAGKFTLMFKDINGRTISDQQILIADRTSSSPSDRNFRVRFCLHDGQYDQSMYFYLHVYLQTDKGLEEVQKIPFEISILFSGGFDL